MNGSENGSKEPNGVEWGQPIAGTRDNVGPEGEIIDHEPMDIDPMRLESAIAKAEKAEGEFGQMGQRTALPWEIDTSPDYVLVPEVKRKVSKELRKLKDQVYRDVAFTEELTSYPSRLKAISNRYSRKIKAMGFESLKEFLDQHEGLRLSLLPNSRALIIWTDKYYKMAGMNRDAMMVKFEKFIQGKGEI